MKQRKTLRTTRRRYPALPPVTCYAAGLLRQYCGWNETPPAEYVEWAHNANPDECQPTPELASWMADCHETNHDEDGHCVGESWPGYVTFEEWKERCAKRHNAAGEPRLPGPRL